VCMNLKRPRRETMVCLPAYRMLGAGVGKTCMLLRFAEGGYNHDFISTVGCAFYQKIFAWQRSRIVHAQGGL
jgi:hypothetical protein